ncbi:MAG TPA: tetratricopeptide repeat protein [Blastocatellia bacterium]|nr:tetratricopeptide repeat protein [Blastocatellia bacterium]
MPAARPIIVFPFENRTAQQLDYNWVGESCALMLTELLASANVPTVNADDRRWLYRQMGFSDAAVLSQASAIQIAEAAASRYAALGSYEISGVRGQERILIRARLLDLDQGRWVGPEIQSGGPLSDLLQLQAAIAWEISSRSYPGVSVSMADFSKAVQQIPLPAYSAYVKARMVEDPATRMRLLTIALNEYARAKVGGPFVPALFEMGRLYFERREYAEALRWLRQVPSTAPVFEESLFYRGLCEYFAGDRAAAQATYQMLVERLPLADVYNNLAAIELENQLLGQALAHYSAAVARAPEDPDIRFNYGYGLWLAGDFENAVVQFRHVLRRRLADGEAHFLLGRSLQKLGRSDEAQGPLAQARHYLPRASDWEKVEKPPVAVRLKTTFNRAALFSLRRPGATIAVTRQMHRNETEGALNEAEALIAAGRDQQALDLLAKVLHAAPMSARAHFLAGGIHERQGNVAQAVSSFQAAIFWDSTFIPAYLRLARIYLTVGQRESARRLIEQVLRMDPGNAEAASLQKTLTGLLQTPKP